MNFFKVFASLIVVVSALECQANQNYVLANMVTKTYGGEQTVRILGNGGLVMNNFNKRNDISKDEGCVAKTVDDQYTLRLGDDQGDGWDDGSYLYLNNVYGVTVYKGRLTKMVSEEIPLSLYTPITPATEWQFSTNAPLVGWADVSTVLTGWNEYVAANWTTPVAGTQYFRTQVRVLTNLAAYDLRVRYNAGAIIYVNGNEVFRDNIPDGDVNASTMATGSYATLERRGVVRSALDLLNPTAVVAVELHFMDAAERAVTFDAVLSQLSSALPNQNCYMLPETDYVVTSTAGNVNYIDDFNTQTAFVASSPATVTFTWSGVRPAVNAWRIGAGMEAELTPSTFEWSGLKSDVSTPVGTLTVNEMNAGSYTTVSVFDLHTTYHAYRMVLGHTSSPMNLMGLFPMVCSPTTPTTIGYATSPYSFIRAVEPVSIIPSQITFINCTITPTLPNGLSLDDNCSIHGIAMAVSEQTYTVTGWAMETSVTSTLTVNIVECNGAAVVVRREGAAAGEEVTVRAASVVFSNAAAGAWEKTICLPLGVYSIDMQSENDSWAAGSVVKVLSLTGLGDAVVIATLRKDRGMPSTYELDLQFPIAVNALWKYSAFTSDWMTSDGAAWSEATMATFPLTNAIQVYKKSFELIQNIRGMDLSLRYQHGVVVVVNGEEVFRDGVSGDVTIATLPSHSYDEIATRVITLPARVFSIGANTITILIVNPTTAASEFNAVLRTLKVDESRLLDHTLTMSGVTPLDAPLTSNAGAAVSGTNGGSIEVAFTDRFETATSMVLRFSETEFAYPSSMVVEGRTSATAAWDNIININTMERTGLEVVIALPTSKPYAAYRVTNITSESNSWSLTRLDLQMGALVTEQQLAYPVTTVTQHLDVSILPMNAEGYTEFYISGSAPEGLLIDSVSGKISGVMVGSESVTMEIRATRLSDLTEVTATCMLIVDTCASGAIVSVSVQSSEPMIVSVISMNGTEVARYTDLEFGGMRIVKQLCLEANVYSLHLEAVDAIPSPLSSEYVVTIEGETLELSRGVIDSADKTISFSSVKPVSGVSTWRVSEVEQSNWTAESFDASSWNVVGTGMTRPATGSVSYLRASVNVADIKAAPVMNVRMHYNGGVIVYLNSVKVARFNLPAEVTATTAPLTTGEKTSNFHIPLTLFGHNGENTLAVEFHHAADVAPILLVKSGLAMGTTAVIADTWHEDGSVDNLEGSFFNTVVVVPAATASSFTYSLTATVGSVTGVIASVTQSDVVNAIEVEVPALRGAVFTATSSVPLARTIYAFNSNIMSSGMWQMGETQVLSGLTALPAGTGMELTQNVWMPSLAGYALVLFEVSCGSCSVSMTVNNHDVGVFSNGPTKVVMINPTEDIFINGENAMKITITSTEASVFSAAVKVIPSEMRLMQGDVVITPDPLGPKRYLVDGDVTTSIYIQNTCVGAVIEWTYSNNGRIPVNEYQVSNANECNTDAPSGWQLYGKREDEWILLHETSNVFFTQYMQTKTFRFVNTERFNKLKMVVTQCNNVQISNRDQNCFYHGVVMSELQFAVKANEDVCLRDGDYPPANHNEVSTIECPGYYTGTVSRLCVNGIFAAPVRNCSVIAPVVTLAPSEFTVTSNTPMTPIVPTIEAAEYTVNVTPDLPAGLTVSNAGIISGTPLAAAPATTYTLTVSNAAGLVAASFTLTIEQGTRGCAADGAYLAAAHGEVSSIPCPQYYEGTIDRECIDGTFAEPVNRCTMLKPVIRLEQLHYNFTMYEPIEPIVPEIEGIDYVVRISPALPAGLTANLTTGEITGTPLEGKSTSKYIIVARNNGGLSTLVFTIFIETVEMLDCAPQDGYPGVEHGEVSTIACPQFYEGVMERVCNNGVLGEVEDHCQLMAPLIYLNVTEYTLLKDTEITAIVPMIEGAEYTVSITPALPAGLTLNENTGVIAGKPTELQEAAVYELSVVNMAGNNTVLMTLAVTTIVVGCDADGDYAPAEHEGVSSIPCEEMYQGTIDRVCNNGVFGEPVRNCIPIAPEVTLTNTAFSYHANADIIPITPSIVGVEVTVTVDPSLPEGMALDSATGVITGAPTSTYSLTTFTMTVQNAGGVSTVEFTIVVLPEVHHCEAADGLPFTEDGAVTATACAAGETGFKLMKCDAGVFRLEKSTCVAVEALFQYGVESMTLMKGEEMPALTLITDMTSVSVMIEPALPSGLTITQEGVIAGTPMETLQTTVFTVSANGMTATVTLTVVEDASATSCPAVDGFGETVNGMAASVNCPAGQQGTLTRTCTNGVWGAVTGSCSIIANLQYTSQSITVMVGEGITTLQPTFDGTVTGFSVNPTLPAGLTLSTTGVIAGTPTEASAMQTYTITATAETGSVTATVTITVTAANCGATQHGQNAATACPAGYTGQILQMCTNGVLGDVIDNCVPAAPTAVAYPSFNTELVLNAEFTSPVPTVAGLNVTFTVEPALPAGLTLNENTGVIAGKPTELTTTTEFIVKGMNNAGEISTSVSLAVVKAVCEKTGDLPATSVDEEVTVECALGDVSVYKCVLAEDGVTGVWSEPNQHCETRSTKSEIVIAIVLFVVAAIILIVAIILFAISGKKKLPVQEKPKVSSPAPAANAEV